MTSGRGRDVICAACGLPPAPAGGGVALSTGQDLPPGWRERKIAGRTFILCECCGDIRHFKGGISLYLQENLGVGPNAQCDFSDEPGSGLHRTRLRRTRKE